MFVLHNQSTITIIRLPIDYFLEFLERFGLLSKAQWYRRK